MFVSLQLYGYSGKNEDKYRYSQKLTDSEFGIVDVCVEVYKPNIIAEIGMSIIQEYSKRNLNVGKNLVLAFIWCSKLHPDWSIQRQIDWNKIYNPLFTQYEEDIQKYLLLL